MGKFALTAIVGNNDRGVSLANDSYVKQANLNFFNNLDKRDVSVNTFLTALKQLGLKPTELAMDLLVVACSMYCADTRISRMEFGEDSWTRQIDLFIPVSDPRIWEEQKDILERIFRFLTGDIWRVFFRGRSDNTFMLSPIGKLKRYKMPYETDTVCLFSGGMDSFIGSINLLSSGVRPLLVGHAKSSDVSPFQVFCERALNEHFKSLAPKRIYALVRIPKDNLFNSEERTERGRSFLFLTLGAICASALKPKTKLIVPENGFISLNIPLTPLRIGSHSTRTTHPFYFKLMKQLFDGLNLGVEIENPYQFKTKGEMLDSCSVKKLVVETNTMSCSHPSGRYLKLGNIHCGYCVPCIIRQAAFKYAGEKEKFSYAKNIFNDTGLQINRAEGIDVMAFRYMIEKVNRNPNYIETAIRSTGPLGDDVSQYLDVYKRSLKEVEILLSGVKIL